MTQTANNELNESLTRIAGLLISEERLDAVLELVVSLTSRAVPTADAVGVTLLRDGRFDTAVYSNEVTKRVDAWQYGTQEGPCLSAITERETFVALALHIETRWPAFAKMALEEGIRSVLSIPFCPMGEPIGALNAYSFKADAFDDESVQTASLFAQQAAIVIANSVAYSSAVLTNGQLRDALESRELIGQAKGILMEREGCSSDRAFEILRATSQRTNRKVREVARDVADTVGRA